jgi:hypothetical protein
MDLQQYALDKSACNREVVAHIAICPDCQSGVTAYLGLFAELGQQPRPGFDFDVAGLVLSRLETEGGAGFVAAGRASPRVDRYFGYSLVAIILLVVAIPAWLFRKSVFYVFTGVSALFLYLILASVLTIVLIRILDMYKKYQRRLQALQFY